MYQINAVTLMTPTERGFKTKKMSQINIIPFDSNVEFGDVPDFDLLQMINEVEERENINKSSTPMTSTTMAMMSSNVLNNVPKIPVSQLHHSEHHL